MAFCERCGSTINAGTQFCRSCGAATENSPAPQNHQPSNHNSPVQPSYPSTAKSSSSTPIVIGLGAFVLAAIIGVGVGTGFMNRQPPVTEPVKSEKVAPLTGLVEVPDMLGIKEAQARDAAKSKSLKLEVTTGASNDIPAGQVVSQYPSAGQAIEPGATMRVRISTGPPAGASSRVATAKSEQPTVIVVPGQPAAPAPQRSEPVSRPRISVSAPSYDYPLSYSDLSGKSAWELDIMRNTIYAKYGRRFARSDLQSYFNRQDWYRPNSGFRDGMLTPTERRNAALIAQYQSGR